MKMTFRFKLLLYFILNLSLGSGLGHSLVYAQTNSSQAEVEKIFSKYGISLSDLSLIVQHNKKNYADINSNKLKIPASVTKLMTTYSLLKNLPQNYKFRTELFLSGNDVCLVGGGDPSFVSENMWFLVNEFYRSGVREIKGNIKVDDTLFDKVRYDESRESIRNDRAYDAPVGAMSFNWNSLNVYVKPTDIGKKARVILDPENSYFELINSATTVKGQPTKELIIDVDQKKRTVKVTGQVTQGVPEKAYYKNVSNPDSWSGENLKAFLKQRGISVKGKVVSESCQGQKKEFLSIYEGKSLDMVLKDLNKFSNNFVAEMLAKQLPVVLKNKSGNLKDGVQIIEKDILDLGVEGKDLKIVSPSGFSRVNQFSAKTLSLVLEAMINNFKFAPALLESLPISGIDGTLKKRMRETPAEGLVRAKTGFLDGVVSLAGYFQNQNKELVSFVFLYNGSQDEGKVRKAYDEVLIYLLSHH